MEKIAAKNKMLFYLATAVLALFLMVSIVPKANAQADITPPDDVENLQIELYDGAVLLSWDVATDNNEVAGYNIYSGPDPVTAEEGEYSNEVIDAGDVIEYLVEGLPNGEAIYFTVTAYDAEGNESINYSNEVYGTPEADYGPAPEVEHMAADEEPPAVADAVALDMETVQVEFSEAIVLPPLNPETAFSIIDNASDEVLEVISVEMDPDDVVGATVLLTTASQMGGSEYILTAGIQIEDTAGNPIVSGTSDTAAFIGSTIEPGADLISDLPEDDFDAPTIASAESKGKNSVEVVFSESVILDSDPASNFFIAEEGDAAMQLDILSVDLDETGTIADIETSDQDSVTYSVIVTGVIDEAGNEISLLDNSATFNGNMSSEGADKSQFSEEFLNAFLNCEADTSEELTTALGSVDYNIQGEKDNLCEIKITYTKNPNPTLNGSGTVCLVDTLMDPEEAFVKSDEDGLCENFNAVDVLADADEDTDSSGLSLTPENVKNFVAAVVNDLVVKLTWDLPDDESIIDQILYKSTDGGNSYDDGTSLGAEREEVDVTGLTPGTEYYFKLTTMNADGVESDGMITSIMLPETGAGAGLLIGASLGLAALNRRRKNKK